MKLPRNHSVVCALVDFDVIQCAQQKHSRQNRAVVDPWPGGVISYSFDRIPSTVQSSVSKFKMSRLEAMRRITSNFAPFSMLTFRNVPSDEAFLHFQVPDDPTECSATVGYSRFARVNLGASEHCWKDDTILHELGHVAGLHHTQNRDDRDEYIRVAPGKEELRPGALFFDFRSIMMYPLDILHATLTTKGRTRMMLQGIEEHKVGHGTALSRIDFQTLVLQYGDKNMPAKAATDLQPYIHLLWVLAGMSVLLVAVVFLRHRSKQQKQVKVPF